MRLIFMGSPDFAVPALAALSDAGHDIACVYSQPPRPAGRGHKERPSAVHAFAESGGLPVLTPKSLKGEAEQKAFAALAADVAVVAAYGLILPDAILNAPRFGCLNIHASLLPRWRGAAPIQRAIMAGDAESGIAVIRLVKELDAGPILLAERTPITPETTAQDLHDTLSKMGARLIVKALAGIADKSLTAAPQPSEGVTYAHKLERDEGRLDWTLPADELERTVRALNPWPGVWFEHQGTRIKVLAAKTGKGSGEPGAVIDDKLTVACGSGTLTLKQLQRAGKEPTMAEDFLRGYPLPAGARLHN
ncbi:MAG: methionyl-tRNA formyltransferase [Rhodospirillales bacterium RIFCSPLOWO2_12_FULL_58_28]|nr:MAG: methionyl-tRNA formyltransferase [Rhodospirillales bacterium RIFCSPLOWO2_02_FULL_58_16]OHC79997.1 MAG: methionyl-tRNA formyltransferase [Rhodospirillales bacterium RIFCSPLOWO2_12_FULL_58_28]